jgi:hypothetical protein
MKTLLQVLKFSALFVGVTGVGVVGGAWLMSPALSSQQRLVVAGGVISALVLAAIGVWLRGESATPRRAPRAVMSPTIAVRSSRASRTPKAVQALAASGAAPMEIAARTGLPLDAVSMLLELAPARG